MKKVKNEKQEIFIIKSEIQINEDTVLEIGDKFQIVKENALFSAMGEELSSPAKFNLIAGVDQAMRNLKAKGYSRDDIQDYLEYLLFRR